MKGGMGGIAVKHSKNASTHHYYSPTVIVLIRGGHEGGHGPYKLKHA